MSEITININGRGYDIACDVGQEGRVLDLATYVDQRIKEISRSGAAYNDSHLMVLAALLLANEALEARENAGLGSPLKMETPVAAAEDDGADDAAIAELEETLERLEAEKQQVLAVIEQLTARVEGLTAKVEAFG
ncbi:MAG: cell division protein ZapA [Alphaproteobacteria bacterium]|nr:MAG: cell division protein ZapA [Alphaproteobacteria bacterium]